ncbi:MAG: glycosyltransferase [Acidobacteria bacterium]|nr:glycosyltransferase [Acidobacteriota bacterium]
MTTQTRPALLFVLPWELHHVGGVNQVVINLLYQTERRGGHHPLLMINSWEDKKIEEREVRGRSAFYFRLRSLEEGSTRLKDYAAFLLTLPFALLTLRRLIEDRDIRVVNLHYPELAALPFALLKRLGLFRGKLILSFHGMDFQDARKATGLKKILWRLLLKSSDAIVACS